ncbi:protein of unknown function [Pararobbsia alpina]
MFPGSTLPAAVREASPDQVRFPDTHNAILSNRLATVELSAAARRPGGFFLPVSNSPFYVRSSFLILNRFRLS